MTAKLTFPAPKRCTVQCGTRMEQVGKKKPTFLNVWADREWTAADVEQAKLAGAFFQRGRHDFADAEAEAAALGRTIKRNGSVRNWLKQLSPEQMELLREILQKEAGL